MKVLNFNEWINHNSDDKKWYKKYSINDLYKNKKLLARINKNEPNPGAFVNDDKGILYLYLKDVSEKDNFDFYTPKELVKKYGSIGSLAIRKDRNTGEDMLSNSPEHLNISEV
jgi:hypothetical protein